MCIHVHVDIRISVYMWISVNRVHVDTKTHMYIYTLLDFVNNVQADCKICVHVKHSFEYPHVHVHCKCYHQVQRLHHVKLLSVYAMRNLLAVMFLTFTKTVIC